jgi:RecQ family ATP-dependent DNA helicase
MNVLSNNDGFTFTRNIDVYSQTMINIFKKYKDIIDIYVESKIEHEVEPKIKYTEYLENTFGYTEFREKQLEIIKYIIEEKQDICAILPTGYGKSICYQLPALILNKPSIVISPLISLMEDQRINLRKKGIKAVCCNSQITSDLDKWKLAKSYILKGRYKIIYITPESMSSDTNGIIELLIKLNNTIGISLIAIDESHCVSMWGHCFRPSYAELSCIKKYFPDIPILCTTATASIKVMNDICSTLKLKNPKQITTDIDRPNLYYYVYDKSSNIYKDLKPILDNTSTIIYCPKCKDTENIEKILLSIKGSNNISCSAYHGKMPLEQRTKIHHDFLNNKITCIIATNSFGMGIDKPDIRQVIHYGCPKDIESYYQETGRAGRDGLSSKCHIFFSINDFNTNKYFLSKNIPLNCNPEKKEILQKHGEYMMRSMEKYLYLLGCRRQYLINYFKNSELETKNEEICASTKLDCCDNCTKYVWDLASNFPINNNNQKSITQNKSSMINIGDSILNILKLIHTFSNNIKYGKTKLIGAIRGLNHKDLPDILKNDPQYGKGHQYSTTYWKECIQYLINQEMINELFLSKFGALLVITLKGIDWLNKNLFEVPLEVSLEVPLKIPLKIPEFFVNSSLNLAKLYLNSSTPTVYRNNNSNLKRTNNSQIENSQINIFQNNKSPNRLLCESVKESKSHDLTQINVEEKPRTYIESLNMFNDGKTLLEIVDKRKLKINTIEDHISKCLELSLDVNTEYLEKYLTKDHFREISTIINIEEDKFLRSIKERCQPYISYFQIKCTLSIIKCNNQDIKNYYNI